MWLLLTGRKWRNASQYSLREKDKIPELRMRQGFASKTYALEFAGDVRFRHT